MEPQMTLADGILQLVIQLAPAFVVLCSLFIVFSWLRILVDKMSGRGL